MGKLTVNKDFDALMEDMAALAQLPDSVINDILNAEADIVVDAQKKEIKQQWSGPYSEGISAKCVKKGKVKKTKDGHEIYIYPQGERKRGKKKVRNGEIAFLNEYGRPAKIRKNGEQGKKIDARPAIRIADEKAKDTAVAAGEKIFHDYLDKLNL